MPRSLPLTRWNNLVFAGRTGYVPNEWSFQNVHSREERFIIGTTGRQVGKSISASIEIDDGMSTTCNDKECHDYKQPPFVGVLAADYSKAEISVNAYITLLTETFGKDSFRMNQNKHELTIIDPMAGIPGARLKWLSAEDPYGVVGFTFSKVIVDEAQAIPDDVWFKFRPTMDVRHARAVIFGTPDITQAQTWFQGLWFRGQDEKEPDYHSFSVASWETPWMSMETILDAKKQLTENEFRRLYGGEWVNEDGAFFTHYQDAMLEEAPPFDPFRRYVMAVDFAVEDDFNAVIVGDVSTKTAVYKERWNKTEPVDTYERIYSIWLKYGRPRVIVDYTGLGIPMAKELQGRGIPVVPFTWSVQTKMPTLGRLAADLQHRRIMFPKAWEDLTREMRGFLRKRTPSGMVTASAAAGFTDDLVMALALLNELFHRTGGSSGKKRRNYLEEVSV